MKGLFCIVILIVGCAQPSRMAYPPADPVPEGTVRFNDVEVRAFVTMEARKILEKVGTEWVHDYRFYLVQFDDAFVAAKSFGGGLIDVDYDMALRAHRHRENESELWPLRVVLAHEIGHDLLDHTDEGDQIRKELEADRVGIELWKKMGWDCSYWIRVYQIWIESGVQVSDRSLPLGLKQAQELCTTPASASSVSAVSILTFRINS